MKLNALLGVNLVAHEAAEEVDVLVEVAAPELAVDDARPPATLVVVLDRSGSMHGARLEGAKRALASLVHRLAPTDRFGLVAFDDQAEVVVPSGPLADKDRVLEQIARVHAGGTTDLSAGYLRALREVKRVRGDGDTGATVLVVSDGHVNQGVRDAASFEGLSAKAYADGVVTSTLGYGEGYDETLLSVIARAGSGNHVFAADPDAAGAAIAGEVDGLLSQVAQAVSLVVRCEESVEMARLFNDLPVQPIGERAFMVELGNLYSGEERKVLLRLGVPALSSLGLAQIASLELQYVELPSLVEHTVMLPLNVNVVPGDEASGRLEQPEVRAEVLFQEAQDAKRRASEAFERGDKAEGSALLRSSASSLASAMSAAPESMRSVIEADLREVKDLSQSVEVLGSSYISKQARQSHHQMSRKRGRRSGEERA